MADTMFAIIQGVLSWLLKNACFIFVVILIAKLVTKKSVKTLWKEIPSRMKRIGGILILVGMITTISDVIYVKELVNEYASMIFEDTSMAGMLQMMSVDFSGRFDFLEKVISYGLMAGTAICIYIAHKNDKAGEQ